MQLVESCTEAGIESLRKLKKDKELAKDFSAQMKALISTYIIKPELYASFTSRVFDTPEEVIEDIAKFWEEIKDACE